MPTTPPAVPARTLVPALARFIRSWVFIVAGLLAGPALAAGTFHDFNGDGKADLLSWHPTGVVSETFLNGTTPAGGGVVGGAGSGWSVNAVADFNGDGKADILWRHTSGYLYIWLLNGTTVIGTGSPGVLPVDWAVIGTGDFNGDGKADILWRHSSGRVLQWFIDGTRATSSGEPGGAGAGWYVLGVADFNGDHKADILWGHPSGRMFIWLISGTTVIGSGIPGGPGAQWAVAGLANFNGDGTADILWRHPSGPLFIWFMNGIGVIGTGSPPTPAPPLASDFSVLGVGDFNGDLKADILLQHVSGRVDLWLMNGAQRIAMGTLGIPGGGYQPVAFPSSFPASKLVGLDFSPYMDGQSPGATVVSDDQMRERLKRIAGYTQWVRFFSSTGGLENGPRIAREFHLKVACGAAIGPNTTINQTELDNLIANVQSGHCDIAIVGTEVLRRGDQSVQALIDYMNQVKQQAPPTVLVGTAEIYPILLAHPELVAASGIILPNHYPYWEGVELPHAIADLHGKYQQVIAAAAGKPVMISETGWPSCGNTVGAAVPSPENARAYAINFRSWATANNVRYLYFEAYDEKWKAPIEGPQGACWGLLTSDANFKAGTEDLLNGLSVADNWSGKTIVGGPGTPSVQFTFVPQYGDTNPQQRVSGQVAHVAPADYKIALYIRVNGLWYTKPFAEQPKTPIWPDGTWQARNYTGGTDFNADVLVAYLVPNSYSPPIVLDQPVLPAELDANAAAKTQVTRSP